MTGTEFETLCGDLLQVLGYSQVSITKESGDQGADILAVRDGVRVAFQCKFYGAGRSVGNKAVQEVLGGMAFYQCEKGVVITNGAFTKSARELASASGVDLWDGQTLDKMMDIALAVLPRVGQSNVDPSLPGRDEEIEIDRYLHEVYTAEAMEMKQTGVVIAYYLQPPLGPPPPPPPHFVPKRR